MSNESRKGQEDMKTINEEERPNTSTSSGITCYFCKKPNRIKKECRKCMEWKKKNLGRKAKKMNDYAQDGTYRDDDESAAFHVCFRVSVKDKDISWYIDLGATAHMCAVTKKSLPTLIDVILKEWYQLMAKSYKLPKQARDLYSELQVTMKSGE